MIRKADPRDLDVITALAIEAHQKSAYSHIEYVEICGRTVIAGCILNGFAWLTECGNGVLLGYTQPLWFDHDKTCAGDLLFYVRENAKGNGFLLARQYLRWAGEVADMVTLSNSFGGDGMDRVERFYERLGLVRIGSQYILRG